MDERAIYTESDGMRALVDIEGYFSAMFDVLNSDETKRFHAACFAMAGLLANQKAIKAWLEELDPPDGSKTLGQCAAEDAVYYADALLQELNRKA